MKDTNLAYATINNLYDNEIITHNFEIIVNDNNTITVNDNSNYVVIFDLQNNLISSSTYDINDSLKHADKRHNHYSNYVAILDSDCNTIAQLWGKKDRVIIEFRKHLFERLECEKLKLFRECEHETYKHVSQMRLCVARDVETSTKLVKTFIERFEKKFRGETATATATETTTVSESA